MTNRGRTGSFIKNKQSLMIQSDSVLNPCLFFSQIYDLSGFFVKICRNFEHFQKAYYGRKVTDSGVLMCRILSAINDKYFNVYHRSKL